MVAGQGLRQWSTTRQGNLQFAQPTPAMEIQVILNHFNSRLKIFQAQTYLQWQSLRTKIQKLVRRNFTQVCKVSKPQYLHANSTHLTSKTVKGSQILVGVSNIKNLHRIIPKLQYFQKVRRNPKYSRAGKAFKIGYLLPIGVSKRIFQNALTVSASHAHLTCDTPTRTDKGSGPSQYQLKRN